MNELIDNFNAWSAAGLGMTLAIVWQSTALACLAALVAFALRRATPALGYWVWQIVAIKLLLMPFWTVGVAVPPVFRAVTVVPGTEFVSAKPNVAASQPSTTVRATIPAEVPQLGAAVPGPKPSWLSRISVSSWLALVWLLGIVWQAAQICHQRVELGRLLARAIPASDANLLRLLSDLAQQVGLSRAPVVFLTDRECSPFVFGVWHPIIVLPRSLLSSLSDIQRRQVLIHELAHIKRHDLLWGWPPVIARLMYWFHPIAHWVWNRIQLQRELACDQIAIAVCGQGAAGYADTLVHVAGHYSVGALLQPSAASAGFSGSAALSSTQKERC
jgi:bla regulator protein blaR1